MGAQAGTVFRVRDRPAPPPKGAAKVNCSSCNNPMFVILTDRAFCEKCYQELLQRQRRLAEDFPRKEPRRGE
jgi:hypothetical protein